ncbi:MAG: S-adenosylmethionine decarboxylase proenzyme [Candidatus Atribacteria bacterium]|nr:S-adenosylmethionine decarboxylase proenzyme [Candidatus Atribacteria bacterium]
MRTEGKHIIMDASGCNPEILNDLNYVRQLLVEAAKEANATVLNVAFHHFTPQGVSGVVVISESHFSIHTWPEYGYAALDFYTCGDINPKVACDYVAQHLKASYTQITEVLRGREENGKYIHKVGSVESRNYGEELSLLP